ncbi:MAG: TRAP transporter substrate-binding protein [Bacteroidetes bacterium]|nr:TRAP transporter substrate-binding protein [Bacteroidota bacterium]MDA1119804.1 TRAP transporter substrate-binding protein [Bacteroidota bacterium]
MKITDVKMFSALNKSLMIVISVLLLCQCASKEEPEFVFRSTSLVNDNHTWFLAFEYFGDILHERSGGRIKLENYHSEQLAKEIEAIRLIQAEIIDMTTTGSLLSNWIEIAAFCELPFFLEDSISMKNFIDGPIGKRMEEEMLNKLGLRPVCYFQRGPRQLTSNRPIRHPDDLQGIVIRVPNVPSFVTAWSALGAKPTPMSFSEVFTSLQQGTIEAQENPLALIRSAGFAEVQDYLNLTNHVVSWVYPVIGEKQFQKLPDDLKVIFLDAAKDMQTYEHQLFRQREKEVKHELEERGMEFIEVDNRAFKEKCLPAIYESLSPAMQKVYDDVLQPNQ